MLTVLAVLGARPEVIKLAPVVQELRRYPERIRTNDRASLARIHTDSGGIQEETPSLHKPVLVLREVTKRQEIVALGAANLIGNDHDRIVAEASRLMEDPAAYQHMASVPNPYGDGRASQRIVAALLARVMPYTHTEYALRNTKYGIRNTEYAIRITYSVFRSSYSVVHSV